MVNQNFFRQKSCEAFKATFPRNYGETDGAWNRGLNVPVLRLQCNSPMVMTFQGVPIDGLGDPMTPIHGQRWSIADNEKNSEKFVQLEN